MGQARSLLTDDGFIAVDAPCVKCEYSLRGLKPDGDCPECGKPIRESVREDMLLLADLAWLEKVSTGTSLLALPFLVGPAMVLLSSSSSDTAILLVALALIAFLVLVGAVLATIAPWWLTAREPGAPVSRLAGWVRLASVAAAIGAIVFWVLAASDHWLWPIVTTPVGLYMFLVGTHLSGLARRLPPPTRATGLWWIVALGVLISVVPWLGPVLPVLGWIDRFHVALRTLILIFLVGLTAIVAMFEFCRFDTVLTKTYRRAKAQREEQVPDDARSTGAEADA